MKEFIQLKNSRFSGDLPFWWGVEEIKEVRYTIGLLACLLDLALMMAFGYSFYRATIISFLFDAGANLILSFISMMVQRRYRLKQNAMKGITKTLNRLALNKTRKSNEREAGFEN